MSMPFTIDDVNARIEEIWQAFIRCGPGHHAPLLYKQPKAGSLVFVSLNPSFSEVGWKKMLEHAKKKDFDYRNFFAWPRPDNFRLELALELDAVAHQHHDFFKPHRDLSARLGCEWEHFDLFSLRMTEQAKAKDLLLSDHENVVLSPFGTAQFDVFCQLLALARPMAVVVINALASRIYASQREPRFDDDAGHHVDVVEEHRFPVFFSGMLTGQRALDRFSRERLYWHVEKAVAAVRKR